MNCIQYAKPTREKTPQWLHRQAPGLIRCLSCFQLYPLIVVGGNIAIHDLLSFQKSWCWKLSQGFFLEIFKEVFHWGIVPTISSSWHGQFHVICCSQDKIRMWCVLMSLVTVNENFIKWPFLWARLVWAYLLPGEQSTLCPVGEQQWNHQTESWL